MNIKKSIEELTQQFFDVVLCNPDTEVDSTLVAELSVALASVVRPIFPKVEDDDLVSGAAEAVLGCWSLLKSGHRFEGAERPRSPVGYLIQSTRNKILDRRRKSSRVDSLEVPVGADLGELILQQAEIDDELARSIDRSLSASQLAEALAAARRADDLKALRVIEAWLHLCESRGSGPSHAAVAREVGLSGPGVALILRRFKNYFR